MEAAGTVGARRATEDGQIGIPQKKEGESDAGGTSNRIAKPCRCSGRVHSLVPICAWADSISGTTAAARCRLDVHRVH